MIRFYSIVFAFVCGLIGWKLGTPGGVSTAYVAGSLRHGSRPLGAIKGDATCYEASVLGTAVSSCSAAVSEKTY